MLKRLIITFEVSDLHVKLDSNTRGSEIVGTLIKPFLGHFNVVCFHFAQNILLRMFATSKRNNFCCRTVLSVIGFA